jgi:hypothetical protein
MNDATTVGGHTVVTVEDIKADGGTVVSDGDTTVQGAAVAATQLAQEST